MAVNADVGLYLNLNIYEKFWFYWNYILNEASKIVISITILTNKYYTYGRIYKGARNFGQIKNCTYIFLAQSTIDMIN